jgi:hypothetical protein
MTLVMVVPADTVELVREGMNGQHLMLHELHFEDVFLFCPWSQIGSKGVLENLGIAFNITAFLRSENTKVMWMEGVSFDATGVRTVNKGWVRNEDEVGINLHKLIQSIPSCDIEDWQHTLLAQYAIALTSPKFCPNQLEYGKRYKLSQMLLS